MMDPWQKTLGHSCTVFTIKIFPRLSPHFWWCEQEFKKRILVIFYNVGGGNSYCRYHDKDTWAFLWLFLDSDTTFWWYQLIFLVKECPWFFLKKTPPAPIIAKKSLLCFFLFSGGINRSIELKRVNTKHLYSVFFYFPILFLLISVRIIGKKSFQIYATIRCSSHSKVLTFHLTAVHAEEFFVIFIIFYKFWYFYWTKLLIQKTTIIISFFF